MTFIRFARTTVLLTLGTAACTGSGQAVRPDDMSAEAHRQQAARDLREADTEKAAVATPPNLALNANGNPEGYYSPVNPGDGAHADRLNRHAQQHLAAATALEAFEDGECKSIPPATRAACPLLGPAVSVENRTDGVRVRFSAGANVAGVLAQMRCHLAYARTRGYDRVAGCALYLRGVDIVAESDGRSVDLLSRDPKVVAEIQARTREEAMLVTGAGH